jgi:hypothetical protein
VAKLIDYDVSDVEEGGGGGSEEPKPSVYPARIVSVTQRDTKSNGDPANDLQVILDLGGDYRWLYSYIGLGEASDWKLAEFVRAVGLKDKGKINPDKLKDVMVRVKVNPDTYEGNYQAKAGRLMKTVAGDELPEPTKSEGKPDNGDEPEDGPVEDDTETSAGTTAEGFLPSREGEEFGSYDDWSDADLAEEVEDRKLTVPGGRGSKRDKHIKALRDDDSADAAEPGDDDAPSSSDDGPADNYEEWDKEQLEKEFEERQLDLPDKPRGRNAADRYLTAMIEALRQDDKDNPFDPDAD